MNQAEKSLYIPGTLGPTIMLKEGLDLESLKKTNATANIEFTTEDTDYDEETDLKADENYFGSSNNFSYMLDNDSDDDETNADLTWFQRLNSKMNNITEDGGVKKMIRKEGVGSVVPSGSKVRIHYNGYMEDLDEPFDSSRIRNQPLQITLEQGQVIHGLDIGISTMRKFEIARFLIESTYAYGNMGCPPRIPGHALVCFEVELLGYSDPSALDDYEGLTDEEKRDLPFKRIIEVSKALKAEGNELYLCEDFRKAIRKYFKAINTLESATLKNESQEREVIHMCIKSYNNIGLCYLKTGSFGKALSSARRVLSWQNDNSKALYICGKALRHLGEFSKSRKYFTRALSVSPKSKDVVKEVKLLDEMEMKFQLVEKQMCKNMFG
nr:inactive peptidyl-prolyl cis-trans isomerase FKBP6 [Ciona intestinalis]|eukprot:XP_002128893.1 inactive peptidyl-prolyl cis-trans isomerase FKBP6 [Ciona intestinalis]